MIGKTLLILVAIYYYCDLAFAQYPEPGPCTGYCYTHDPSLIQRETDKKWFRFTTHYLVGISTADDIAGPWTNVGSVLVNQSVIDLPGNQNIWAPDVKYYNGQYWCFYAVSRWGDQHSALGVAVSDNMEPGTWTDLGYIGIISLPGDRYNAIDSSWTETPEGKYYMNFGSYNDDIFIIEMRTPVVVNGSSLINIAYNPAGSHSFEGSYMYYREGFYYLFFSAGQCCKFRPPNLPPAGDEYHILVCRSESIEGPFVDKAGVSCVQGGGTTIYASYNTTYAPGGQGVYNDTLYYHYIDTTISYLDNDKRFGWNKLNWEDGWPVVV